MQIHQTLFGRHLALLFVFVFVVSLFAGCNIRAYTEKDEGPPEKIVPTAEERAYLRPFRIDPQSEQGQARLRYRRARQAKMQEILDRRDQRNEERRKLREKKEKEEAERNR